MKDVLTVTTENESLLGNFVDENITQRRVEKVKRFNLLEAAAEIDVAATYPDTMPDFEAIDRMRILDKINFNHNYGFTASGVKALPEPPSKILGLEK